MTWQIIISVVAALFPPGAFATLLISLVRSHDFLLDSRMRRYPGEVHYSFVVANALEQRVAERVTLLLELVLADGQFIGTPKLLCGPLPTGFRAGFVTSVPTLEKPLQEWSWTDESTPFYVLTHPYSRTLSTWVLSCRTNGCDGDVLMHLFVGRKREATVRGSVRPPRSMGRGYRLWLTVTALAVISYVAPREAFFLERSWTLGDTLLVAVIVAVSVTSFALLWEQRRRPVFVYGGWDPPTARE